MHDRVRKRFVIYAKTWIDGPNGDRFWKRAVVRTESSDFISWSKPNLVIAPGDEDSGQIHGAPAFFRHGIYFALVQRLNFGPFDRGGDGDMPVELATSRDGIRWARDFRKELFLPTNPTPSTFDAGCLWSNSSPVFLRDEIRFYYGAYPSWSADVESVSSGIGFASLPRDRFVAIESDEVGQITLKPVRLSDSRLQINADARGGEVRVELLSSSGYRIPGFTKEDAVAINEDSVAHNVRWNEKQPGDATGEYQIRIHLKNAKLFALTILDAQGESATGTTRHAP